MALSGLRRKTAWSAFDTGGLCFRMLGHTEAAKLFQETLQEEKGTDKLLTVLASGHINQQAVYPVWRIAHRSTYGTTLF